MFVYPSVFEVLLIASLCPFFCLVYPAAAIFRHLNGNNRHLLWSYRGELRDDSYFPIVPKFSELKKGTARILKNHRVYIDFHEFSHIGDGFFQVHYGWRCGRYLQKKNPQSGGDDDMVIDD